MERTGDVTLKILKDFAEGKGVTVTKEEGEKLAAMVKEENTTENIVNKQTNTKRNMPTPSHESQKYQQPQQQRPQTFIQRSTDRSDTRYTLPQKYSRYSVASKLQSYYEDLQKAKTKEEIISLRNRMIEDGLIQQSFQASLSPDANSFIIRDGDNVITVRRQERDLPEEKLRGFLSEERQKHYLQEWDSILDNQFEDRIIDAMKGSVLSGLQSAAKQTYEHVLNNPSKSLTGKLFSHFFGPGKDQGRRNWLIGIIFLPLILQVAIPLTITLDLPNSIRKSANKSTLKNLTEGLLKSSELQKTEEKSKEEIRQKQVKELKKEQEKEAEQEKEKTEKEAKEQQEKENEQEETQQEDQQQEQEAEPGTFMNEASSETRSRWHDELQQAQQEREQAAREESTSLERRPEDLKAMPDRSQILNDQKQKVEAAVDEQSSLQNQAGLPQQTEAVADGGLQSAFTVSEDANMTLDELTTEVGKEITRIEALQGSLRLPDTIGLDLYKVQLTNEQSKVLVSGRDPDTMRIASKNTRDILHDLQRERLQLESLQLGQSGTMRALAAKSFDKIFSHAMESIRGLEGKSIDRGPVQNINGHLYYGANQLILQAYMQNKSLDMEVFLTDKQLKERGLSHAGEGVNIFFMQDGKLKAQKVYNIEETAIEHPMKHSKEKTVVPFKETKTYKDMQEKLSSQKTNESKEEKEQKYLQFMLTSASQDNPAISSALARIMSGLGDTPISEETQSVIERQTGIHVPLDGTYQDMVRGLVESGMSAEQFTSLSGSVEKSMVSAVINGIHDHKGLDFNNMEPSSEEQDAVIGLDAGADADASMDMGME